MSESRAAERHAAQVQPVVGRIVREHSAPLLEAVRDDALHFVPIVVLAALAAGLWGGDPVVGGGLALAGIFALGALGYDVITGYTGQFTFAVHAMMSVGAYAVALTGKYLTDSVPLQLLIVIAAGVVVSLVVALPSVRLRGFYFAIITIAFAELVMAAEIGWIDVTGGASGMVSGDLFFSQDGVTPQYAPWIMAVWTVVAICMVIARRLTRTRTGRVWRATAVDELTVEQAGVSAYRTKLAAATISGVFAALSGFFYAHYTGFITPTDFSIAIGVQLLLMMYFGGAGTLWGPLVGALVLTQLSVQMSSSAATQLMVYGGILLVTLTFARHGVVGLMRDGWRRIRAASGQTGRPLVALAQTEEGA